MDIHNGIALLRLGKVYFFVLLFLKELQVLLLMKEKRYESWTLLHWMVSHANLFLKEKLVQCFFGSFLLCNDSSFMINSGILLDKRMNHWKTEGRMFFDSCLSYYDEEIEENECATFVNGLFHYSSLLYENGDYNECIKSAKKCLSLCKRSNESLGEIPLLQSAALLSKGLCAKGLYDKATQVADEYSHHPLLTISKAMIDQSKGDFEKAISGLERGLKALDDKESCDYHMTLYLLTMLKLKRNDNFDDCLRAFEQCKVFATRFYGTAHSFYSDILVGLAMIYVRNGFFDQALKSLEQSLRIKEKVYPRASLELAQLFNYFGVVYNEKGDYKSALEWYEKSRETYKVLFDENHKFYLQLTNNILCVHLNAIIRKEEEIKTESNEEKVFEEVQRMLKFESSVRDSFGENSLEFASVLNNIALIYKLNGFTGEALEYLQRCKEIEEKMMGGQNQLSYASTLFNLASLYDSSNDWENALKYYKKALQIEERANGKNHNYAVICNNLALIYKKKRDYQGALKYYEISLYVKEKIYGKHHSSYKSTLQNLEKLRPHLNLDVVFVNINDLKK